MPFLGKSPSDGNHNVLLDAITTSATATYNLTKDSVAYTPVSAQSLMVSLNGVTQAPIAAYTVSGSTIVFASALTSNDVIDYVIAFEGPKVNATLDDNTVTTAMIQDNAITSAKIGVDVIVAEDLAANSITVSEITDGVITEAKLNIDNTPTNDYVLTAKSSAAGGLTWAASAATAGITSSADGTAMTIDSSERIVTPYQPLFSACSISSGSGGSLHTDTSAIYNIAGAETSGTMQAVSFGQIWANVGSHWSNSTGVFTVPVAGRYYCYFNNNYHEHDSWPNAHFMHDDKIIAASWMNHSENASKYSNLVACAIVVAAVNDKLWPAYRSDYDPPYVETNLGYHSCQIMLIG